MKLEGTDVARRIQRLMRALNLNQNQLAERLQITQPAVSKYLQGRIPPADILLHLAELANVSIEWILTGRANSVKTGVAEPAAVYAGASRLQNQLDRLPPKVRGDLDQLITSLTEYF